MRGRWFQREHRALARGSAKFSGAVEYTPATEYQIYGEIAVTTAAGEIVQNALGPRAALRYRRCQGENRATAPPGPVPP